jgi:hypothetical protein
MTGTIPPISGNKNIRRAGRRTQRSPWEVWNCINNARFVDMEECDPGGSGAKARWQPDLGAPPGSPAVTLPRSCPPVLQARSPVLTENDIAAFAQLSALDVKRYLLGTGWERVSGRRVDVGIFRRPGSDEAEVVLPLSLDFTDVPDAMARAVAEIARVEQRPVAQVLRDLRRPRSDVLLFAVESRDTADGGIGLDEGLGLRDRRRLRPERADR